MAALCRRLRAHASDECVPLLVLRIPEIARKPGVPRSTDDRILSTRCLQAVTDARARMLRGGDVLAYDGGAHVIVALLAPARARESVAAPADCRATLARLSSALRSATGLRAETGWTIVPAFTSMRRLHDAIDEALRRGSSERERHAFFGAVGHELRTPLTAIRGYLETLLDEDLDAVTARRFLETAQAEAARMERLIDGLRDVAALETDARLEGGGGDVLQAMRAALDAVGPAASVRRTVITQLAWEPRRVVLSTDRLTQILINVLENAVKHGREAGTICVTARELDDRYAELRVDDDGPGVPSGERVAVFMVERRGINARSRGSGLGLALVRLMVERIGGEVDVGQSPLGGASFGMRIPLAPAKPAT
jgi:signal transduction histidine kinase